MIPYCDKIKYDIFAASDGDFSEMVDELLSKVANLAYPLRLTFFGAPASNEQYVERRAILADKVAKTYGDKEPVLCYVSQPSLDSKLVLEAHHYDKSDDEAIHYNIYDGFPYAVLENDDMRMLFAGGFHGDLINENIRRQSDDIFSMIDDLMRKEGFPIENIVRQWNYIERITDFDGSDQHYQMFNNSRSEFYAKADWRLGYPAATGIGANLGGVVIDVDAVVLKNPSCAIVPIDNKLQVAAHAYSDTVLERADKTKSTPKFERAKSINFANGKKIIYVSGTAAIRGEESLTGVGIDKQTRVTMENIDQLIGDADIKMLRVYLKNPESLDDVKAILAEIVPDIPISYMHADVCRDELLIEIEGIATT